MDVNEFMKVLDLPVQTLAILSAGYLSYRLAYTGKDSTHRTVDVVFLVFVFAFVAKASGDLIIYRVSQASEPSIALLYGASILGIVGALLAAAVWRSVGEKWMFDTLRRTRISFADRHPTAWQSVIARNTRPSVMVVTKTDGSRLMSEGMAQFSKLPFGACILGHDGSVALYVTHRQEATGSEWIEESPGKYQDWGANVTVVPASEVAEIALRSC